jgi:hypothetical protein
MTIWIALAGGLVLGWLIEWIIDWTYWRRGVEAFYATEQELRRELAAVRRELDAANTELAELRERAARRTSITSVGNGR